VFRYYTVDRLADEDTIETYFSGPFKRLPYWPEIRSLTKLARLLHTQQDEWSKRIEGPCIDIYTNSKKLYDNVNLVLAAEVKQRFEPEPGTADQLDNPRTVVVKKLPHDRFEYKVFLGVHKADQTEKESFINFLETHSKKIKCTTAVKTWIRRGWRDYDRRYILVEDEPTLLLLKMAHGNLIGQTYSHVLADK